MLRRIPNRLFRVARQSVVEEIHVEVCDDLSTIKHTQLVGIGEGAKHGGLNRFRLTDRHQFIQVLRRHSDYHPLLCFRKPDLPRIKGCVFERYVFEVHICPYLLPHLTDGRGKPTGTTIRDIAIELAITRLHQGIDNFLFHNRIADLHHAAEAFGRVVQFQR